MGSGAGKLNNTEAKIQAVSAFTSTMPVLQETQGKHDLSKFSEASRGCLENIKKDLNYFVEKNSLWGSDGKVKIYQELADKSAVLLEYNFDLMRTESSQRLEAAAMVHAGLIYKELGVIENIVKLMIDLWNTGFWSGEEENDMVVLICFKSHLSVFQTLTYYDPVISEALCEAGFLKGMAQWLGELQEKHLNGTGNEVNQMTYLYS